MIELKSRLEKYTCLAEKVKIYVPSTVDVDKKVDNSFFVNVVMEKFSRLFGGATAYNASGAWYSDTLEKLVVENITVVEAFTSEINNHIIDKVIKLAEWLKDEMKQEAVSLEVNGKLYFV